MNDFGFRGGPFKTGIMRVVPGTNTAYISNYQWWKKTYRESETKFFRGLITAINHETLHKVLRHVKNKTASNAIDKRRVFGAHVFEHEIIGIYLPIPDPNTFPLVEVRA